MLDWLLGKREKTYPILKSEMLQPVDNKLSTQEVKKLFREWMLKIGYLDKDEVHDHVGYFADEIREQEQNYKDDIKEAKENLAFELKPLQEKLAELKKKLSKCTDETTRAAIEEDIADTVENMTFAKDDAAQTIAEAERDLAAFKADKREFLINAVNTQVHGGDWRSKL